MPVYRFRLEGKEGHRTGSVSAPNREMAEDFLAKREGVITGYALSPQELKGLEAEEKTDGATAATTRARLAAHRQAKPYKLVSLEEADG